MWLKQTAQDAEPPVNIIVTGCGSKLNAASLLCFKAYFLSVDGASHMLDGPANSLRRSAIQAGRTFDDLTSTWVCHFSADAATACSVISDMHAPGSHREIAAAVHVDTPFL